MDQSEKVNIIKSNIDAFEDFPKKGIVFRDVFSILRDPSLFTHLIDLLKMKIKELNSSIDVIVGLDSRGFIFGSVLAYDLQKPFVPIRKKGKLPGEVAKVNFKLEYGEDSFEIQKSSIKPGSKVLIVDDLLATGGTMKAACDLVSSLEAEVSLCLVCIELTDLNGRSKLGCFKCESIVEY